MINKKKIAAALAEKFPAGSFVRRSYNKKKLDAHLSKYMDAAEAAEAEADLAKKAEAVKKYEAKFPHIAKQIKAAIEKEIAKAPAYKDRKDDAALRLEMKLCKYAYGFEPDEFLCYNLEKLSPDERKKFVSDRDLMCYVYRMNDRVDFMVFNDKARTYEKFHDFYNREAEIISSEADFAKFEAYVKKHPVFVKKHVYEAMGRSVELIDVNAASKSPKELFDEFLSHGKFIVEEKVCQSSSMAAFNESSVNTVRCITFNTKKGIVVPYCFIKVGRKGSFIDNGGAGGILSGIDPKTGKLVTDGFNEYMTRFEEHPDSGVKFKGYQLPEFGKAVELAKKLSAMMPSVRFIGWDFAHTDKGWVVIEGNGMSQLIGPQIVFERGVKQEVEKIIPGMDLIL